MISVLKKSEHVKKIPDNIAEILRDLNIKLLLSSENFFDLEGFFDSLLNFGILFPYPTYFFLQHKYFINV